MTGLLLLADDQANRLLGDDGVIWDLALVELVDLRAKSVEAAVEIRLCFALHVVLLLARELNRLGYLRLLLGTTLKAKLHLMLKCILQNV